METTTQNQAPTKKPRGRPAGAESADSRSAILDAAEMLFAHNGYAGTSTRAIADQVKVNPAMIHYYFGSKNVLLEQVLDRALELFDELKFRWQYGRTLFELGQLAYAKAEADAAQDYFSQARVVFEDMGAIPDVTRTNEVIEAAELKS